MVGAQCAKNNPLCYSAGIYFLKVNNGGTRTMCEIYSKLTPTTLSMLLIYDGIYPYITRKGIANIYLLNVNN